MLARLKAGWRSENHKPWGDKSATIGEFSPVWILLDTKTSPVQELDLLYRHVVLVRTTIVFICFDVTDVKLKISLGSSECAFRLPFFGPLKGLSGRSG